MTERIGPVPGMPAPQPVVPISQPFSSQAGVQSFRRGTPLSGAQGAAAQVQRFGIAASEAMRTPYQRRANAGWPGLTGPDGLPIHA